MGRISLGVALILVVARAAGAQPVSYSLKGDVPIGKKPELVVTAVQAVTDLRVELDRDDGKKFSVGTPALPKGKSTTFAIGDGAAGKASYKGKVSAKVGGTAWSDELNFDTLVRAPIKVTYDADHLDLEKRVLQFKLSRPASSATLSVIGEDGKELGTGKASFEKPSPDEWLSITWTQPAKTTVMMLKLRVVADDGAATNLELIPWQVVIDHEDVNFATDSAVIETSEHPKLDASLAKIGDAIKRAKGFMKMKLYVAGHTDTVGTNAKNKKLSIDRARAIASYFRKKGVKIPIAFAGYGEEVLRVKTADNTDERANRRADYVIGPADGAPPFKGPYLAARATWLQIK
jgi:outer membrane protein OmpA-like peptidoglycan-associated protein